MTQASDHNLDGKVGPVKKVFQSFSADSLLNVLGCWGGGGLSGAACRLSTFWSLTCSPMRKLKATRRKTGTDWGGAVVKSWAGMTGAG